MRGLGIPLLVVSDGAPGVIRAIEECFPRSARQRCLAHRMRNLAVKVPTDLWPEFKTRVAACYQARSRAIARELAKRYPLRCPLSIGNTAGLMGVEMLVIGGAPFLDAHCFPSEVDVRSLFDALF